MSEYVPLRCHSRFSSPADGLSLTALVGNARKLGIKALALADEDYLFGALRFHALCNKVTSDGNAGAAIKPIVGCDLSIDFQMLRGKTRILLLAKNGRGYRNLCELSSMVPGIDQAALARHAEGLVALSGGRDGAVSRLLCLGRREEARAAAERLRALYGMGNFFLEITDHDVLKGKKVVERTLELSRETGVPIVATCEKGLASFDEMASLFAGIDGALENTLRIAELAESGLRFPEPVAPGFEVPPEFTEPERAGVAAGLVRVGSRLAGSASALLAEPSSAYLVWRTIRGISERYGANPPEDLLLRSYDELAAMIGLGMADHVLVLDDSVRLARRSGIAVGPGRGASAGSVVNYALGITDLDPVRHGLSFEPFINAARPKRRDLEIDVCCRRQAELVDQVLKAHCPGHVARALVHTTVQKTETIAASPNWLVIGNRNLAGNVPLCRDPATGVALTQYTADQLSGLGWNQTGFFGMKELTALSIAERLINFFSRDGFRIARIPEDDERAFELLRKGRLSGMFRFGNAAPRLVLRELKPTSLADIAIVCALAKPYMAEVLPRLLRAKAGRGTVAHPHPALAGVLKETRGVPLYSDQIAKAAREIAGYSGTDADLFRRTLGMKRYDDVQRERERFREGAARISGLGIADADRIFDFLVMNAAHCVNKAHAFSSATVVYRMAYCKAHWSAFFLAARLVVLFARKPRVPSWPRFTGELW